jgi:4-hydroxy-3-polyprenylbenzoate decarboxylase
MAYRDLRDFMEALEERGLLRRVGGEVDPYLEVTEILDRTVKAGGPALLFERVKGSPFPMVGNLFGSQERMEMALETTDLAGIGERLAELLRPKIPTTLGEKIKSLPKFRELTNYPPRRVKKAPCQEVVMEEPSLEPFPIPQCWPQDGGRYLTLPLVFTHDPETGERNVGMYRMQVFDAVTTAMHWQIHKHGADQWRRAARVGERFEVAVALGGDPATIFSAVAPLPKGFDELLFAGFLRGEGVEMVGCQTVELEVPAHAEIILEGYVDPTERREEGPFGDHTGYYSLPDLFPVFHITSITHRADAIYPTTIVGRPPMEDAYLGKAVERIFLPLLRFQLPEIVEMNLPIEGVFHNLCIVSIRKEYPGHARKVICALWGLGQMMFTKTIVVVDHDVDVHNPAEVLWVVSNSIDPKRDIFFVEGTPSDTLDHATPIPNLGSKMGIDATRKWRGEGYEREWPDEVMMDPEVKRRVEERWRELGL